VIPENKTLLWNFVDVEIRLRGSGLDPRLSSSCVSDELQAQLCPAMRTHLLK
jgi:hypothetical protein